MFIRANYRPVVKYIIGPMVPQTISTTLTLYKSVYPPPVLTHSQVPVRLTLWAICTIHRLIHPIRW
jgi:hypothetical protein